MACREKYALEIQLKRENVSYEEYDKYLRIK